MPGIMTDVTDSIAAAYNYVYGSVTGFINAVTASINAGITSVRQGGTYVRNQIGYGTNKLIAFSAGETVAANLAEGWKGHMQSLNPVQHPSVLVKPKIQRVLTNGVYNSLVSYLGLILFYEGIFHPATLRTMPNMEDSWADWTLDHAAQLYFQQLRFDHFVNFAMTCASLSTAIGDELSPGANYQPCKHVKEDPVTGPRSDVMSNVYYIAKRVTVGLISLMPVVGPSLAAAFSAFVYGETLVESKLASGKQCSEDRHAILAANQAYSIGLGVSLVTSAYVLSWAISTLTERYLVAGVRNEYIDDAAFSIVYLYYMLAAQMITDPLPNKPIPKAEPGEPEPKKLPGMHNGLDVFYPAREVAEKLVDMTANKLAPLLSGVHGDLYERIKILLDTTPARAVRLVLLPESMQSLEAFMQRPSSVIFFDLHKDKILAGTHEILQVRESGRVQFYKFAEQWGVGKFIVSKNTKGLLDNVILWPGLVDAVEYIEKRINRFDEMAHPENKSKNGKGQVAYIVMSNDGRVATATGPAPVPVATENRFRIGGKNKHSAQSISMPSLAGRQPESEAPVISREEPAGQRIRIGRRSARLAGSQQVLLPAPRQAVLDPVLESVTSALK